MTTHQTHDDVPGLATRTYEVDVRLTAHQWVTIRVDAPDEDEARRRAEDQALPHGQWDWDEEETYSEAKLIEDTP